MLKSEGRYDVYQASQSEKTQIHAIELWSFLIHELISAVVLIYQIYASLMKS